MFNLLNLFHQFFGFLNVNTKLKGKVYTCIGFICNWYLLYVGMRFIDNGKLFRGFLFILVFVFLLYCILINFYFYFLNKRHRFDPSEKIAKWLGDERLKEEGKQHHIINHGVYRKKDVVPASVQITHQEYNNLLKVVNDLISTGILNFDYNKKTDKEIKQFILKHHTPFYAIGSEGFSLPYFNLVKSDGSFLIYGGINQKDSYDIAYLDRVGLSSVKIAAKDFDLYLATVNLEGGLAKQIKRSGLTEEELPYKLKVEVAFDKRK